MVFGTSAIERYMKIGFYAPSGNYIVTLNKGIGCVNVIWTDNE
jgi:hypothetical protein